MRAAATPDYGRLLLCARRFYEQGRHYESARACARIEEVAAATSLTSDQTMELGVVRALLALDSADFGLAEEHCRQVVASGARESDAWRATYAEAGMLLGRVLARTDRLQEAIEIMASALEVCPDGKGARGDITRFDLLRQLGQSYGHLNEHHDASEVLDAAFAMALEMRDLPRELLLDVTRRSLKAAEGAGDVDVFRRVAFGCLDHLVENGIREHDWREIHRTMGHMTEVLPEEELDRLKMWFSRAEEAYERDREDGDAQSRVEAALDRFYACHDRLRQMEPGESCESDLTEFESALADAWNLLEGADLLPYLYAANAPAWLAGHWKRMLPMWRRAYARLDRLVGVQPVDVTGGSELLDGADSIALLAAELGELDAVRVFRHAMADRCIAATDARGAALHYRQLAGACVELGDFEEALTELTHCEEVFWSQRDEPGRIWLGVAVTRARALTGLARLEEAEVQWRHVMEGVKADDGHPDAYGSMLCAEYAECMYLQGRKREAIEMLVSSRAWRANPSTNSSQQAKETERLNAQLARACIAVRMRVPDAPLALRSTLDELEKILPNRVPEARTEWAKAMLDGGARMPEAFSEAVRGLRSQRRMRHGSHPLVISARAVMREAAARMRDAAEETPAR